MLLSLPGRRAVKQAYGKETFKYGKETLKSIVPFWRDYFREADTTWQECRGRTADKYFLPPEYIGEERYVTLVYDFCTDDPCGYSTEINFYALKEHFNVFLNIQVRAPGLNDYDTPEHRKKILTALGITPAAPGGMEIKGYAQHFFIEVTQKYTTRHGERFTPGYRIAQPSLTK